MAWRLTFLTQHPAEPNFSAESEMVDIPGAIAVQSDVVEQEETFRVKQTICDFDDINFLAYALRKLEDIAARSGFWIEDVQVESFDQFIARNRHPVAVGPKGEIQPLTHPATWEVVKKIVQGTTAFVLTAMESISPEGISYDYESMAEIATRFLEHVMALNQAGIVVLFNKARITYPENNDIITPDTFGALLLHDALAGKSEVLGIKLPVTQLKKHHFELNPQPRLGAPYPPSIPSVIRHEEAAVLEKEIVKSRHSAQWMRTPTFLEVPMGEVIDSPVKTLLLLGGSGMPNPLPLTGREGFNAQGLEGKVQLEKPLSEAVMLLIHWIPPHRGRILVMA